MSLFENHLYKFCALGESEFSFRLAACVLSPGKCIEWKIIECFIGVHFNISLNYFGLMFSRLLLHGDTSDSFLVLSCFMISLSSIACLA